MKKSLRILSLALVLVMSVLVLASCTKKPSGTYSNELLGSYTFKGNKVTYTAGIGSLSVSQEGTFKMKEDDNGKTTISFTFGEDGKSTTIDHAYSYGTEEGKDYISIDGIKYFKE